MALTIEDGTGVAGATSWATVEEADAVLDLVSDPVWPTLEQPAKERHLTIGALYVSNGQVFIYSGARAFTGNVLAFPRKNARYRDGGPAVAEDEIPAAIRHAQIVAASASAHGTLPTLMPGPGGGGDVQTKSLDGVGSMTYFDPKRQRAKPMGAAIGASALETLGIPAITGLVAPLLDERVYFPDAGAAGASRPAPIVGPAMAAPLPRLFHVGFTDAPGGLRDHLHDNLWFGVVA